MGQIVILTINGPLFLQVVQLTNTYHEVRQVEKCIPEKQISENDFQYFIYLKNGKKFELRYGKNKSETFEGYYFKHSKYNKGVYTPILKIDRIKDIKNFLRLNFTRTEEQNKLIYRFGARKTRLYKTKFCWKCGGSGYIQSFKHVRNGVCFICNEDGHKPEPEGWSDIFSNRVRIAERIPIQLNLDLENS